MTKRKKQLMHLSFLMHILYGNPLHFRDEAICIHNRLLMILNDEAYNPEKKQNIHFCILMHLVKEVLFISKMQ